MDKSFGKSFAMLPVKQSPVAAAETKNMSLKIHGHDGILEKIIDKFYYIMVLVLNICGID